MEDIASVRVIVVGRVQGVFYRQSTRERALALGLKGWVRNQADGNVFLEAIGPRDKLVELLEWCRKGPVAARVDELRIEWLEPTVSYASFDILR